MAFSWFNTGTTLVISLNGKTHTVYATDEKFEDLLKLVRRGSSEETDALLGEALAPRKRIEEIFASNKEAIKDFSIVVYPNKVTVNGLEMKSTLIDRILAIVREEGDVEPFVNFLKKVVKNPLRSAQEDLFTFLEACKLPITKEGNFLAYKVVGPNYLDKHTSTINNNVGDIIPRMSWEIVDKDRNQTCSVGYHVCSRSYIGGFASESEDHLMVCEVDPSDVASVPVDYNAAKMRVVFYKIVDEIQFNENIKDSYDSEEKDQRPRVETIEDEKLPVTLEDHLQNICEKYDLPGYDAFLHGTIHAGTQVTVSYLEQIASETGFADSVAMSDAKSKIKESPVSRFDREIIFKREHGKTTKFMLDLRKRVN